MIYTQGLINQQLESCIEMAPPVQIHSILIVLAYVTMTCYYTRFLKHFVLLKIDIPFGYDLAKVELIGGVYLLPVLGTCVKN